MRSRTLHIAAGVLFLLFSTNAYACLYSMAPTFAMAASMPMPMDDSMPSHDGSAPSCQTVQCDALNSQNRTDGDCLLSSAASTLQALSISPQDTTATDVLLSVTARKVIPPDGPPSWKVDDSPRPRFSVPPFLLFSSLLL